MGMARSFRKPTLRQIEVFKAVIETGTVSRAAETLNMSQPAASKLLSNLEADIGMELFERRRGLLVPTERGIRFYEEVDRIFSGLDQIGQAVEALRSEERGRLTVGVLPALSGTFISTVIREFARQKPGVFLSLHARSSQFLVDWMRSGKVDICLVAGRVEDAHIAAEPILRQAMVCLVPLHHPLAARPALRIGDVAAEPVELVWTVTEAAEATIESTQAPEEAPEAEPRRILWLPMLIIGTGMALFAAGGIAAKRAAKADGGGGEDES